MTKTKEAAIKYRYLIGHALKQVDLTPIVKTIEINGIKGEITLLQRKYDELRVFVKWNNAFVGAWIETRLGKHIQGKGTKGLTNRVWDNSLLELEEPKDLDFKLEGKMYF